MDLVPTPLDGVETETSAAQQEVEAVISEILKAWGKRSPTDVEGSVAFEELDGDGSKGIWEDVDGEGRKIGEVKLDKESHVRFLKRSMGALPAGFVALDASRPWLLFWGVNGCDILDHPLDLSSRAHAIATLLSCQHPSGGFGGGPGQMPHLAPTYAAILALVCLAGDLGGSAGPEYGEGRTARGDEAAEEVWSNINRRGMYEWMMKLKQDDGSFVMHEGGEVDVRGCYCCIVVATLLDVLTPALVDGTEGFIASCQTYEGGLASASHPASLPSPIVRPPLGEAHGGYASCSVLCHFLLRSLRLKPEADGKALDVEACLRWATMMQALPIEGGGFRGRTNKLVDGCYSWWCAGLFPVLEALLPHAPASDPEPFFDRLALQEYTLLLAQSPVGGLRDKPGKVADGYHTHYNLAGLSTAQHRMRWSESKCAILEKAWRQGNQGDQEAWLEKERGPGWEEHRKAAWAASLAWEEDADARLILGDRTNETAAIHPCFLVRPAKVKRAIDYFYDQRA